jgi:lathosterol oxidase
VSYFFAFLSYFIVRALVVSGVAFWAVVRWPWVQAKRVYPLPWGKNQIRNELWIGLRSLVIDAAVVAVVLETGVLKINQDLEAGPAALMFGLIFVWFEAWFYYGHRALHSKLLYRFHHQHHTAQVTSPWTSLNFSIVERLYVIVGALFVPIVWTYFWGPVPFPGVVAYFLFNYLFNVYGHLNVEFLPENYHESLISKVWNSVTYHAVHHARYQGHYGLFTPIFDRIHGTGFSDFNELYKKVVRNGGLRSLNEKGA